MANLDFFAAESDQKALIDFLFSSTDVRVFESYSAYDKELRERSSGPPRRSERAQGDEEQRHGESAGERGDDRAAHSRTRGGQADSVFGRGGGDEPRIRRTRRNAVGDIDEHPRRRAARARDLQQLPTLRAEAKAVHQAGGDVHPRAALATDGLARNGEVDASVEDVERFVPSVVVGRQAYPVIALLLGDLVAPSLDVRRQHGDVEA